MARSIRRAGRAYNLSFVASAQGNAASITIPATARGGDIAVLFDYSANSGAPVTFATPSGFTTIATSAEAGTFIVGIASFKILSNTDPSTSVTGMTNDFRSKVMMVFRPVGRISGISVPTWSAETTSGNPSSQSVLASGLRAPALVFGMAGSNVNTIPFSTASPAFDDEIFQLLVSTSGGMRVGYKIYNSAPADHTVDMNDLGNDNTLVSGLIRVQ